MDWTILSIQPTKDKKAITAAYRAQLSHTNPEDKPEEFKALRAAYEEAMQLADQAQEPAVKDESPVGLWTEELKNLYHHFPSRICAENWKQLLQSDVCISLDTRTLAEEALLRFLMEEYNLPQAVWLLLDNAFSWSERCHELYEKYPKDFIDYVVIDGIRYPDSLPYDLFTPGTNGADCDAFCRLYHRATRASGEDLASILEQMDALSENHPYGDAQRYRLMIDQGDADRGREGCRKLAEMYPDEISLVLDWAALCMNSSDWLECERLTRHVLELNPRHQSAKRALAESLAQQGKYDEAKDLIYELMNDAGGNQKRIYELGNVLREWNEHLILQREQRYQECPDDDENSRELAWCYLQNERADDATHICEAMSANYTESSDSYDYHNLCAKTYFSQENWEISLQHLQAVEQILRDMQPDGTEKTEKRLKKLPEFLQMQGRCLMALERNDDATEKYEQALAVAPDNPEIVTNMGRILYSQKQYERSAELFEHLTVLMPNAYHGYFLLAANLYELGRDRDAFDAVNRALDLDGSDLFVYILKMRILLRNGVWDGVHEILDFLHNNGIENEINTDWCQAQLVDREENDHEKALKLYQDLAARVENGESLDQAEQLYYRLVVLLGEQRDCRKEEDRQELLALLEKGLSHNPDDFNCLDYKAWLLKRDKQYDEALEIYLKLEHYPHHTLAIEQELAELYYRDLSRNADKALHYYQMLLDNEESGELHFYVGTCRRYLHDFDGAEKDFLREQDLDPDDIDGYKGLCLVYQYAKKYPQALTQAEKVLEMIKDHDGDQTDHYYRIVHILRRLNRPMDAITVLDEMSRRYPNESTWSIKYDILCQFGLWEDARSHLKAWKRSRKEQSERMRCAIKLELLTEHTDDARKLLRKYSAKLSQLDSLNLAIDLADIECDGKKLAQLWSEMLELTHDRAHALSNLAQLHRWYGSKEDTYRYAQMALEELEEMISRNKRSEALYRSRRAICLALLDRMDEALTELAAVRTLPLCEGCSYCSCKDADIYEANFAEITGDYEKALQLCRAGREQWPDDQDFIAEINRLKKKGYIL